MTNWQRLGYDLGALGRGLAPMVRSLGSVARLLALLASTPAPAQADFTLAGDA